MRRHMASLVFLITLGGGALAFGREEPAPAVPTAAERGYRTMLDKPFVPPWFDGKVFANLWSVWPEPLRSQAKNADPATRRQMTLERYGLDERPGTTGVTDGPPLQFASDEKGRWTVNCFACHAGSVAGQVIPGLPNSHLAYKTLAEEVLAYKLKNKIVPSLYGLTRIPLGQSNGTTNAVVFSITLLQFRDKDLNVVPPQRKLRLPHHDLDAPAWWNYAKRERIYVDGFGKKNARTLMQFALVPQNGPAKLHQWESDFDDIVAYIESVKAPKYPFPVDAELARVGKGVFRKACTKCHGTYGARPTYPTKDVPIDDVGTDRARFDAITPAERKIYSDSWLSEYDPKGIVTNPQGYVAPPLDGIWASAPYLHNGSVPTLWHLLHPDRRPKVWQRTSPQGYDKTRVGLPIEVFDAVPETAKTGAQKRTYFDTSLHGKSAAGHLYPTALGEDERRALLEYLKTL